LYQFALHENLLHLNQNHHKRLHFFLLMRYVFLALLLFLFAFGFQDEKVILFLGDSLSAGFGLDVAEAFPSLIQKRIEQEKLPFKVVNAGLSGETTAGGLRRIDWLLKQKVDVLVIELGGNDGLRGIAPSETEKNLQGIIDKAREKNPDMVIVLAGMQAPPNMGKDYTEKFRAIFPRLAKKNSITLIPFLLEGVAGNPNLNLPDGIHPTAEGHRLIAQTVWSTLNPVLTRTIEAHRK
jgi:acyl-CoA thioesterase-1